MKNKLLISMVLYPMIISTAVLSAANPEQEKQFFQNGINRLFEDSQNKLPGFLRSIGATKANIDAETGRFEVEFDDDFLISFVEGGSFELTDRGGSLNQSSNEYSYLSYRNNSKKQLSIELKIDPEVADSSPISLDLYLIDGWSGNLRFSEQDHASFIASEPGQLQWNSETEILTVRLQPEEWITFEVQGYNKTIAISSADPLPSGIEILTGRVPDHQEFWPKFKKGTSLTHFVSFLSDFSESTIKAALADFEKIESTSFRIDLSPDELNTADKIIAEYADVRLLVTLLKGFQATTLITRNYNTDFALTADQMQRYEESEEEILNLNPNFLKPRKNNPKERQRARTLFEEAVDAYLEPGVSERLWHRGESEEGEYLFELGLEEQYANEADRERHRNEFDADMRFFKRGLREGIQASDGDESEAVFLTLAPLFGATPVDLRSLIEISEEEDEEALLEALTSSGIVMVGTDFFGLPRSTVLHERNSEVFGEYNDTHFDHEKGEGWIYHNEHGWLYFDGIGFANGSWAWDHLQQEWLWTGEAIYPFFFSDQAESWRFYEIGGEPKMRWFYFYEEERWLQVQVP